MKMTTLSPKKATVYSPSSIPSEATDLKLVFTDPHLFNSFTAFPSTLTKLSLQSFDGPVTELPRTITHIITSEDFNLPVDDLPPTLTHLTTGCFFNQPVDKLPPALIHLTTGLMFNHPVDHLPQTLTHLVTGFFFNQSIDNLPPTLTHLTTGIRFNQPIPPALHHHVCNNYYTCPVVDLTIHNSIQSTSF
jgi:hypothetical protein